MLFHVAACDTEATATALASALKALNWDVSETVRSADGDYPGGLFVSVRYDVAPVGVAAAMEEHADSFATIDRAEVGAWKDANYVGDNYG